MPSIRYKKKTKNSYEAEDIKKIIKCRDLFVSDLEWGLFTLVVTTGMRRSEVLAINIEQLYDGCLLIDIESSLQVASKGIGLSINEQCQLLEVPRSGYYRWLKNQEPR